MKHQSDYDVCIIGSGVGGLCTAALLAHWGYRTLVIESTDRLGGRCSTEEVEGFKLSTGAVALHRGGVLEEIFREVGAELELVDMPHQWYRIGTIGGENYVMPAKGAISALLEIANSLERNRAKLLGNMAKEIAVEKVMNFFGRGVRGEEKADDLTFSEWLSKYTENELAHKTFDAMACNVTCYHAYELTASEMFALFAKMASFPALGISPRGNEANMESLAKAVQVNGGDVWLGCSAQKILIRNGVAVGVVIEKDGRMEEVSSLAVVSNAGPRNTVKLAGPDHFDGKYLELVNTLQSVGMILIHVASDRPLCMEDGELGGALLVGLRRLTSAFPLTNFSADLAPPGKHLLYCVGSPPSYLEPINVDAEIEQARLDLVEQFPEFSKSGKILKCKIVFQELPKPGRIRIPRHTPVRNLFNVGDAVPAFGSGGTTAAAESARDVAHLIRKQIKLE